jgi:NDP-sugar pyrophosphorylase family protein
MNSDLLTDIDLEDFYLDALRKEADMSIATVPYNVTIPYAVLNLENDQVKSLSEKPSYTYYSNAGMYIIKRELLDIIPSGEKFDATDLIEYLIKNQKKVCSYPIRTYWLDIGKMNDFEKAQKDISHLKL